MYRKSKAVTKGGRAKRVKVGGWRVGYINSGGQRQDYVLKLPNGTRVTDKSVAESMVNAILRHEERKGAGIIDPIIEAANMPIRQSVMNAEDRDDPSDPQAIRPRRSSPTA